MKVIVTREISEQDQHELLTGLRSYNSQFIDLSIIKPLAVFYRDAQDVLQGGLIGRQEGEWFNIQFLWVHEARRGSGLGSDIMQRAATEAKAIGCKHALVDTASFQALPFYQKLGFQLQMTLPDHPLPGMQRYFLTKSPL
ncbi:GNAT family N-acetyltransferase [Enterobacter sp. Bisph1]|uniref:GNAT family N-acetyltransferase n=1 Tax=Enterobacter sp. Bisph1 TaxID=1274399 RepID=UPI00057BCFD3|nr:GNAT family N-acetyltransferase [Enterobacter sp. Bisph1]